MKDCCCIREWEYCGSFIQQKEVLSCISLFVHLNKDLRRNHYFMKVRWHRSHFMEWGQRTTLTEYGYLLSSVSSVLRLNHVRQVHKVRGVQHYLLWESGHRCVISGSRNRLLRTSWIPLVDGRIWECFHSVKAKSLRESLWSPLCLHFGSVTAVSKSNTHYFVWMISWYLYGRGTCIRIFWIFQSYITERLAEFFLFFP